MSILSVIVGSAVVLSVAFGPYRVEDGSNCVPASKQILLGQHFSAIAASGPILGAIWFGWGLGLAWRLLVRSVHGGETVCRGVGRIWHDTGAE